MSSSGHPAGVFSADCTLKSWPWRFWVFHVWVFSGSPSGSECSVLCFRHGDVVLWDLPCSSVGGLHCPGLVNARQNRMGDRYHLWVRSGFLVRLGRRIVGGACRSCLPQVVACRWDRRSQSPSGSGCLGTGVLTLGHEPVGFVSLGPVALVLSLRVFFVKNLLSSWYLRSPLRGYCFGTLVPWFLTPLFRVCGGCAGPGLPGPARLDRSLVLGPGFLVCRLPSVSLPWVGSVGGFVSVSTF